MILAQLCWFVAFLATVLRWHLLLGSFEVPHRFRDAFRLSSVGLFFSQVIPGATGGDVVRGVQIARESPTRRAAAVLSVLVDRVLGLSALMTIGVVGLFFLPQELRDHPLLSSMRTVLITVLVATALAIGLGSQPKLWRGRSPRWFDRLPGASVLRSLAMAFWTMHRRVRTIGLSFLLSLLAHSLFVATALCLGRALTGVDQSPGEYFFLVPLGQLAFSLPITPGGTGVGQWAYEELFSAVGHSFGAELGVLLQLTSIGWGLLGAIAFLWGGMRPRTSSARVSRAEPPSPGS